MVSARSGAAPPTRESAAPLQASGCAALQRVQVAGGDARAVDVEGDALAIVRHEIPDQTGAAAARRERRRPRRVPGRPAVRARAGRRAALRKAEHRRSPKGERERHPRLLQTRTVAAAHRGTGRRSQKTFARRRNPAADERRGLCRPRNDLSGARAQCRNGGQFLALEELEECAAAGRNIRNIIFHFVLFDRGQRVAAAGDRERVRAAIARASVSVPLPKASNSNTPTGPFQTTVPALAISAA